MASLTIRKLDEALKARLRLRAARSGRSVEEELRHILAAAASEQPASTIGAAAERPGSHLAPSSERDVPKALQGQRTLLVIGGGIAAYKSLDLIRRLRERGARVRCVLTRAGEQFVTELSVSALAEGAFTDLFDPRGEFDVGHIRLAREADLIVVAPATADLMAKMAGGHADDLATAVLLATRAPILLAPAMNPQMWANPATRRNVRQLAADGVQFVGPGKGEMAESGEAGVGRMAEPLDIVASVIALREHHRANGPLAGKRVLVTSGPTHEPIDPVRYIANRSSGRQGHAIAAAAAEAGAHVILVSGPAEVPDPVGVELIKVETAQQMFEAVEAALPVHVGIFAAAVADWRVANAGEQKLKKTAGAAPSLKLVENPDILATVAHLRTHRPQLVIGFAAETEHVVENAQAKRLRKGCDWIVANDVSPQTGIMGGESNTVHLVTADGVESWPTLGKDAVAARLIERIAAALAEPNSGTAS